MLTIMHVECRVGLVRSRVLLVCTGATLVLHLHLSGSSASGLVDRVLRARVASLSIALPSAIIEQHIRGTTVLLAAFTLLLLLSCESTVYVALSLQLTSHCLYGLSR